MSATSGTVLQLFQNEFLSNFMKKQIPETELALPLKVILA